MRGLLLLLLCVASECAHIHRATANILGTDLEEDDGIENLDKKKFAGVSSASVTSAGLFNVLTKRGTDKLPLDLGIGAVMGGIVGAALAHDPEVGKHPVQSAPAEMPAATSASVQTNAPGERRPKAAKVTFAETSTDADDEKFPVEELTGESQNDIYGTVQFSDDVVSLHVNEDVEFSVADAICSRVAEDMVVITTVAGEERVLQAKPVIIEMLMDAFEHTQPADDAVVKKAHLNKPQVKKLIDKILTTDGGLPIERVDSEVLFHAIDMDGDDKLQLSEILLFMAIEPKQARTFLTSLFTPATRSRSRKVEPRSRPAAVDDGAEIVSGATRSRAHKMPGYASGGNRVVASEQGMKKPAASKRANRKSPPSPLAVDEVGLDDYVPAASRRSSHVPEASRRSSHVPEAGRRSSHVPAAESLDDMSLSGEGETVSASLITSDGFEEANMIVSEAGLEAAGEIYEFQTSHFYKVASNVFVISLDDEDDEVKTFLVSPIDLSDLMKLFTHVYPDDEKSASLDELTLAPFEVRKYIVKFLRQQKQGLVTREALLAKEKSDFPGGAEDAEERFSEIWDSMDANGNGKLDLGESLIVDALYRILTLLDGSSDEQQMTLLSAEDEPRKIILTQTDEEIEVEIDVDDAYEFSKETSIAHQIAGNTIALTNENGDTVILQGNKHQIGVLYFSFMENSYPSIPVMMEISTTDIEAEMVEEIMEAFNKHQEGGYVSKSAFLDYFGASMARDEMEDVWNIIDVNKDNRLDLPEVLMVSIMSMHGG